MIDERRIVLRGEARDFITDGLRFATLATNGPDGWPHQAVLWYEVRGDVIMVNSRVGRHWPTNLLRDPRCTLTVEDGYDYVLVRGEAEPVPEQATAQADIAALAYRYHDAGKAERMVREEFSRQERISFHIHPRSVAIHH
jgi:PPOX class probable F420-dependent enzyme